MGRIKDFLFLHLCVMLFSFTSVFSKSASICLNRGGLRSPGLYVFLILMLLDCVLYAFFWQKIIKRFDLHIAYANRSVYLFWSQIWAVYIFHEHLTVKNILGLMIVFAGVFLVSVSSGGEKLCGE